MDKILMQRANVVLEVSPEDKGRYMERGYSVIDAKGNITEEAIPTDVPTLQSMVSKLEDTIKAKDAEIEKLKAKNKKVDAK